MKIGVMGGTFNPIHNGHLIISEYIRDYLHLDEVIFIPAGQPPHKDNQLVLSSKHRFNMVNLAIQDNSKFRISDREMNRRNISYTINTIKQLRKEDEGSEYYFIIGGDSLFNLEKWYNFSELAKITTFALCGRKGHSSDDILRQISLLSRAYNSNIIYIEGPLIEISSSQIRDRIVNNKSIKYLVPDSVNEYIKENNLYSEE